MTAAEGDATTGVRIRDAASVILVRWREGRPHLLMGQRGSAAVFMPDKFVFPGGAVDPEDSAPVLDGLVDGDTLRRLQSLADPRLAPAIVNCALRELREETGIVLGCNPARGSATAPGPGPEGGLRWSGLRFIFRAVTPPGRPRRFDARFFLADAGCALGSPDDFSAASDELRLLQWIDIGAARDFPLPFITEVVLSEVSAILADPARPRPAPFFHHTEAGSHFHLL